jgi:hypothetical protein
VLSTIASMPNWPNKICAFCGDPATGQGEHTLPRGFLRRWQGQGGFKRYVNGQVITGRDGFPQETNDVSPLLLPCCGSGTRNDCNGWLNQQFEIPGLPHVRAALDDLHVLDRVGTVLFARWWVKTLLLLHHPDTRDSFPKGDTIPWEMPPELLPNLRASGHFPPELSLWVALADGNAGTAQLADTLRIFLPIVPVNGHAQQLEAGLDGFSLPNGRLVLFQLVFHPRCDFDHPFEKAGLAVRLWPNPPASFDITSGPALSAAGLAQWKALFVAGGFAHFVPEGYREELPAVPEDTFPLQPRFKPDPVTV